MPAAGEGPANETEKMMFGQFRISQATRTASLGSENIDLTTAEFDLLWLLASHAGNVLSRDDLLQELRGIGFDGLDRSIDARMSRPLDRRPHIAPAQEAERRPGKPDAHQDRAWQRLPLQQT